MSALRNTTLAPWTVLGLGGPARRLCLGRSTADVVDEVRGADARGEPLLVLGGGSNVVIADDGFPGTVILVRNSGITTARPDGRSGTAVTVTAAAGESLSTVVEYTVGLGLAGLECLAGIPGTVGGTPVQNVGAYGQEVADVLDQVTVYDRRHRKVRTMHRDACRFGHRTSVFKDSARWVILDVTLTLPRQELSRPIDHPELAAALGVPPGGRTALREVPSAVTAIRRRKGMVVDPADPDSRSVGSFFANPVLPRADFAEAVRRIGAHPVHWPLPGRLVKVSAAWLIERAGYRRGDVHGGVRISRKHALALTNPGAGTATELVAFATDIRNSVARLSGIVLTCEPELVNLTLGPLSRYPGG